MNLATIELGPGDHRGIDIDVPGGTGNRKYSSSEWASFDGVHFKGAGRDLTHITPAAGGSQWDTVAVGRHDKIVAFSGLTIHAGRSTAYRGLNDSGPEMPNYALHMADCGVEADVFDSGTWGLFVYRQDTIMRRVRFMGERLRQHTYYHHGYARDGVSAYQCWVQASGGENFKFRCDADEVPFVAGAECNISESVFSGWYKPHSDVGGGGIVMQASGFEKINLYRNIFWAPLDGPGHTRCLMLDENEGKAFWDIETGRKSVGYANGDVLVLQNAFRGGNGASWLVPTIRCGNNSDRDVKSARSFKMHRCAVYGHGVQAQLSDIPEGKLSIEQCNTPNLRNWAHSIGIDTSEEAYYAYRDRRVPLSEGVEL